MEAGDWASPGEGGDRCVTSCRRLATTRRTARETRGGSVAAAAAQTWHRACLHGEAKLSKAMMRAIKIFFDFLLLAYISKVYFKS